MLKHIFSTGAALMLLASQAAFANQQEVDAETPAMNVEWEAVIEQVVSMAEEPESLLQATILCPWCGKGKYNTIFARCNNPDCKKYGGR